MSFNLGDNLFDGDNGTGKPTKVTVQYGGITFFEGLQLVFIGLKLAGHISWPWLVVFSPAWLAVLIVLFIYVLSSSGK